MCVCCPFSSSSICWDTELVWDFRFLSAFFSRCEDSSSKELQQISCAGHSFWKVSAKSVCHWRSLSFTFWSINCWMTLKIKFMFHFLDNLFTHLSSKFSTKPTVCMFVVHGNRCVCVWCFRRTGHLAYFQNQNAFSAEKRCEQEKKRNNRHAEKGTAMTLNDV